MKGGKQTIKKDEGEPKYWEELNTHIQRFYNIATCNLNVDVTVLDAVGQGTLVLIVMFTSLADTNKRARGWFLWS